ncbi:3-hydroxyacyl-CoA dehydrogenase [Guyanagaster necrorhizus]|uniref:3-hydroxyacyl-CoA dehydrogenase n=1 Tax=Guyanagaster necrorhizus TaxID=856835 RepID=A0A9P7VPN4_9AGAR|nr:3-hydroxyacyl-CoA dehydrogenase [Guyanagaster necrorhizus MCA 3950]KAG7444482.1 3-hydroxyacyl-CoA dehydrogenase [Guyanagaster necrorhizus MCA 3950]
MKIENRTFLVSGGSSGLGLATVRDLLSSKAYVSIVDRTPPPSDIAANTAVLYSQTDITELAEIERAVEQTVSWTKETGAPLGGVINCAGVATAAKILSANNQPHALDLWEFTIAVNLTGTFNLTRLALKHLVDVKPEDGDGERGVVVMVASAAAFEGQPGQTAYAATKGAVRSMALPMARDLARHGIRVVTIAPGVFESSMTKSMPERTRKNLKDSGLVFPRRFGLVDEFAKTVRWVLECAYVNGETIRLSGAGRLPGKL